MVVDPGEDMGRFWIENMRGVYATLGRVRENGGIRVLAGPWHRETKVTYVRELERLVALFTDWREQLEADLAEQAAQTTVDTIPLNLPTEGQTAKPAS